MTPIHLLLLAGGAYAGLVFLKKRQDTLSQKNIEAESANNAGRPEFYFDELENIIAARIAPEKRLTASQRNKLERMINTEVVFLPASNSPNFRDESNRSADKLIIFVLSRTNPDLAPEVLYNIGKFDPSGNLLNNLSFDVRSMLQRYRNRLTEYEAQ